MAGRGSLQPGAGDEGAKRVVEEREEEKGPESKNLCTKNEKVKNMGRYRARGSGELLRWLSALRICA